MTATASAAAAPAPAQPGRGSLLRAEVLRFRSRRLIALLLAIGIALLVVTVSVVAYTFRRPTAEDRAYADRQVAQVVAQQAQQRQRCLADPQQFGAPPGVPAEQVCGDVFGQVDASQFLPHRPFLLAVQGRNGVVGVGIAVAVLMFLVGATWIGAEWSSRSIVALLFWEPRRLRVIGTKIAVLAAAAAVVAVLAELAWLAAARVLASTRGSTDVPPHFWREVSGSAGRVVLLAVLMSLLGFGFANLVRNSAAAMGVGFVYFAVAENAVRILRPTWQGWLLSTNAAALVSNRGASYYVSSQVVDGQGGIADTSRQVLVSNLHGAVVLTVVCAVVVAAGVALFARRDLG